MFTFQPIYFNINILAKKIIKYLHLLTEGRFISLPSYHYANLVTGILRCIFILMLLSSLLHLTHNKVMENNSQSKRKV